MIKLTEDAIRELFGDKTFFKGLDYWGGFIMQNTFAARLALLYLFIC